MLEYWKIFSDSIQSHTETDFRNTYVMERTVRKGWSLTPAISFKDSHLFFAPCSSILQLPSLQCRDAVVILKSTTVLTTFSASKTAK